MNTTLELLRIPIELQSLSLRVAGKDTPKTPRNNLEALSSKLTQYDRRLQARQPNNYRLGHFLKALAEAKKTVTSMLDDESPEALGKLKSAILKVFEDDLPPVKAVLKQIDSGAPPSLV